MSRDDEDDDGGGFHVDPEAPPLRWGETAGKGRATALGELVPLKGGKGEAPPKLPVRNPAEHLDLCYELASMNEPTAKRLLAPRFFTIRRMEQILDLRKQATDAGLTELATELDHDLRALTAVLKTQRPPS